MKNTHAIYLSDSVIIFFAVTNSGVELLFEEYSSNPDFKKKYESLFTRYKNVEVTIFLDLIGEEYKHESIPHVSGKDREILLDRKQQSLFPTSDLVWKKHIKREKTGRKDDVYLMMGIQLPKMVKDVFGLLVKNKYAVSGVYSMSILETVLQKALSSFHQYLVVSRVLGRQKSDRSYRQTFIKNEAIVISRVTRAKGDDTEEALDSLISEIERMHHFLNGSKHLDANHTLSVITALGDKETRKLLSKGTHLNINIKYLDLYQLASKLELRRPKSILSLPELLANLAISKKIAPHFKPKELCAKYQQNFIGSLLKKATAVMMVISLLVSIGLWWGSQVAYEEAHQLNIQMSDLKDRHNISGLEMSGQEISPQLMKSTVQLYDKISTNQYKPNDVFDVLAEAYIGFSDITILQVNWVAEKVGLEEVQRQDAFLETLKKPRQFTVKLGLAKTLSDREVVGRVESFSKSLLDHAKVIDVSQTSAAINIKSSGLMERTVGAKSKDENPIEFTLMVTMKL
tara:strand:- start:104178 stop:105719 length:1542 start_codon:yes stop_codon:yes gene_type:complete